MSSARDEKIILKKCERRVLKESRIDTFFEGEPAMRDLFWRVYSGFKPNSAPSSAFDATLRIIGPYAKQPSIVAYRALQDSSLHPLIVKFDELRRLATKALPIYLHRCGRKGYLNDIITIAYLRLLEIMKDKDGRDWTA